MPSSLAHFIHLANCGPVTLKAEKPGLKSRASPQVRPRCPINYEPKARNSETRSPQPQKVVDPKSSVIRDKVLTCSGLQGLCSDGLGNGAGSGHLGFRASCLGYGELGVGMKMRAGGSSRSGSTLIRTRTQADAGKPDLALSLHTSGTEDDT